MNLDLSMDGVLSASICAVAAFLVSGFAHVHFTTSRKLRHVKPSMAPKVPDFDCIIVGLGGHGSAIAAHLAAKGANVLGVERFTVCALLDFSD